MGDLVKSKKLAKMTETEILELITKQHLCRIAFTDNAYPYVSPFQYVVHNYTLYFHFTDYGKKMEFLKKDTPVCIEVENYTNDFGKFAFVILQGKLQGVDDPEERKSVIEKLSLEGKKNFSDSFLLAHGLTVGSKWSDLNIKASVIVKLHPIVTKKGLKSDNYDI
jgi:nitroimidazol reductase NimA-like FMN-containing flavoprotein (pyridoxamine 5'-phosphate oxidase superfamily)